jgi:hypothetical protein
MAKQLVDMRQYVAIGNDEFVDTSFYSHLRYKEFEKEQEIVLSTFDEAYDFIKNDKLANAEVRSTLFGKPQVVIFRADFDGMHSYLTEKHFKPIRVKKVCETPNTTWSIMDLAKYLPAEDFVEWLKDHGITMIKD